MKPITDFNGGLKMGESKPSGYVNIYVSDKKGRQFKFRYGVPLYATECGGKPVDQNVLNDLDFFKKLEFNPTTDALGPSQFKLEVKLQEDEVIPEF